MQAKTIIWAALFTMIGFAGGVILTCYLSAKSAETFLEVACLEYKLEQEVLAIRAKRSGDIDSAIRHYKNVLDASSAKTGCNIGNSIKANEIWTIGFPFASLVLQSMMQNNNEHARIRAVSIDEGRHRAKLADALERGGRIDEATVNYIEAAHLLDFDGDVGRVKSLVRNQKSYEDGLLQWGEENIVE